MSLEQLDDMMVSVPNQRALRELESSEPHAVSVTTTAAAIDVASLMADLPRSLGKRSHARPLHCKIKGVLGKLGERLLYEGGGYGPPDSVTYANGTAAPTRTSTIPRPRRPFFPLIMKRPESARKVSAIA